MITNIERVLDEEFKKVKMMGIEEGIQKGMQKGELKKAREIAKEMLKQGSDIAFIKKVTKLSEEEILNLKSKA